MQQMNKFQDIPLVHDERAVRLAKLDAFLQWMAMDDPTSPYENRIMVDATFDMQYYSKRKYGQIESLWKAKQGRIDQLVQQKSDRIESLHTKIEELDMSLDRDLQWRIAQYDQAIESLKPEKCPIKALLGLPNHKVQEAQNRWVELEARRLKAMMDRDLISMREKYNKLRSQREAQLIEVQQEFDKKIAQVEGFYNEWIAQVSLKFDEQIAQAQQIYNQSKQQKKTDAVARAA
jgi:hypothetical protein